MRKFLVALVLVLMLCVCASADDGVIKVGIFNCLTGQNAFGGQLELEGTQLAHSLFPEILGRKVELVIVDNKSDKVEAANAVTRLIENDKVNAIIGTYGSSLAMAGGEVAEKAGIPVIGTSCTNPLVTLDKKFYFRVCFIDPFQGAGAATYAFRNLGLKKAATLVDMSNDYSVGLGKFFRDSFKKMGGEIVASLFYQSGDTDFTAQLTALIDAQPDIVFLPAYFAEGAIVLKQAKELGAAFRFIGADAMDNPEIVTLGGDAVEGFMHTTFAYDPSMPEMNEVAKAFTAAWNEVHPDKAPNVNCALGYDCYIMLKDAIERAGSADPAKIRDALEATRDLPTVTGMTTINATHDAEKDMGIVEIRGGKKTFVGIVVPEV
ncbi:MAG: ABC transporter substrate-binding protein [Synergistaceae bacterium]|nr:ABC transporter substrate-binding protein [Synergistaceae bacterium]